MALVSLAMSTERFEFHENWCGYLQISEELEFKYHQTEMDHGIVWLLICSSW
jgi:hypothetical protein